MRVLVTGSLRVAFFLIVLCIGFFGLPALIYGGFICDSYTYKEYMSPNTHHKATVSVKDCGAVVEYRTLVSITPTKGLMKFKKNVFIIDGHPTDVAPNLLWHDENTLKIKYQIHGYEKKAKTSSGWFNKIIIEYESS